MVDKQKPQGSTGVSSVVPSLAGQGICCPNNSTQSPKNQYIDNGLYDRSENEYPFCWLPDVTALPPIVPDGEKTAYFRGGDRKWNGKFIDDLPKPKPIDQELLESSEGFPIQWSVPKIAETFRAIDYSSDQDRSFAGYLAQFEAEAKRPSISSNVSKHHERATDFQSLPPLVGVRCYKSNVELVRAEGEKRGGGERGQCKEISQQQFKNAVRILTDSEVELNSILTVTYPGTFPTDGRIFKAHLKRFLERLRETVGGFDYFEIIEYQQRGAPHSHIGLSPNLAGFGEVVTLKREPGKRRSETFETVQELNRKAFDLWRETIAWHNNGVIKYNGQELEWWGISEHDHQQMERAFVEYNSGVSWEVMREQDGAKNYFVKELTGKKGNGKGFYQKSVPEGFQNPGRHFLYSKGFVNKNYVEFPVNYDTLCYIVQESKLEYVPDNHKPLYKWLWNASVRVANNLVKMGYTTVSGSLDCMRKYWDVRAMGNTAGHVGPMSAGSLAYADYIVRAGKHWKDKQRSIAWKLENEGNFDWLFSNAPPIGAATS